MLCVRGSSPFLAKTLHRRLLQIPGRLTLTARRWTLHLPARWPWQHVFEDTSDDCSPCPRPCEHLDTATRPGGRVSLPGTDFSTTPLTSSASAEAAATNRACHPPARRPRCLTGRRTNPLCVET